MKELGSGSYGVVFLVQNKITCKKNHKNILIFKTAEQRAVKAIAKDRIEDQESFSNEITILRTLVLTKILHLFFIWFKHFFFNRTTPIFSNYMKYMKPIKQFIWSPSYVMEESCSITLHRSNFLQKMRPPLLWDKYFRL